MADHDSRAGARYAAQDILDFTARIHGAHDAGLQRAFDAPAATGLPAIQVGPNEGQTLQLLLRMIGAHRVVEIGTLAGYSAIWMARALPQDARSRLWTIELDRKHADVARANIEAAGVSDRVEVIVGDAIDVLEGLASQAPFCAVFIDADKARYDRYGDWACRHLRPGGLLIGDNAYLFGRLLDDSPEAAAMRRFHELAATQLDSVCVPTPDGLVVGRKRSA